MIGNNQETRQMLTAMVAARLKAEGLDVSQMGRDDLQPYIDDALADLRLADVFAKGKREMSVQDNYAGNYASGALNPDQLSPQAVDPLWEARQARFEAEAKERELLAARERRHSVALEAALRCQAGVTDHQLIIRVARDFAAFLEG